MEVEEAMPSRLRRYFVMRELDSTSEGSRSQLTEPSQYAKAFKELKRYRYLATVRSTLFPQGPFSEYKDEILSEVEAARQKKAASLNQVVKYVHSYAYLKLK